MDKKIYIDLNETPPLSSPREQHQQQHQHNESLNSLVTLGKNVRVCSSCEFGSRKEEVEENQQQQKEEWKCFRCVLGCPSLPRGSSSSAGGGSGGGGGGADVEMLDMNVVPPLDMNASPPREGAEREGLFHFVDLNKDLPVVEEDHKAKDKRKILAVSSIISDLYWSNSLKAECSPKREAENAFLGIGTMAKADP